MKLENFYAWVVIIGIFWIFWQISMGVGIIMGLVFAVLYFKEKSKEKKKDGRIQSKPSKL